MFFATFYLKRLLRQVKKSRMIVISKRIVVLAPMLFGQSAESIRQ